MSNERKGLAIRFPLYVTKRIGFSKKKYWLIRLGGVLLAFLMASVVCTILKPGSFGMFYEEMFRGTFGSLDSIIDLLIAFSILLLISITLTPAFKMKFWNIGAEGQILVGCMAAAGIAKFMPRGTPEVVILLLCLFSAQALSMIWCLIPALFKTFFKTNETLFTLMMNYIAAVMAAWAISEWVKSGSQSFGSLYQGVFPAILGNSGTLVIPIAAVIFVGMYFYLKKSKHGYEVTVLGESIDTARYAGINVTKVTLRTMAISGALFGTIGFFLVCAIHQSFNETLVGGQGFTGVLIAWLGHFDPLEVLLFAFLSSLMQQGTTIAASSIGMSAAQFSAICTGVFFFIIIACEFFSRYKVRIHHDKKKEAEQA